MIRKLMLLAFMPAAFFFLILPGNCTGISNDYDSAMSYVEQLSASTNVRLLSFGQSRAARKIPAFVISDFSAPAKDKVRILICSGQHGDEISPVYSVFSFSKYLASGARPSLLANAFVIVIPMVNPDGIAGLHRANSQGIDVNRDWDRLYTKEAQYVNWIIKTWQPQVLIDAHEWFENPNIPTNSIEMPHCDNTNRQAVMASIAGKVSAAAGVTVIPCSKYSSKALFHRYYTSKGYGAFLLETSPGISYEKKRNIYKSAILTIIGSVCSEPQETVALSPASINTNTEKMVVKFQPAANQNKPMDYKFPLIPTIISCIGYCVLLLITKTNSKKRAQIPYKLRSWKPNPDALQQQVQVKKVS